MDSETFERIFEDGVDKIRHTLIVKAREYADDSDRMRNFTKAAAFIGGTPEQALWGYLVKHLISISDMIESGQKFPEGTWDEKVGDALTYLFLLRALVVETNRSTSQDPIKH